MKLVLLFKTIHFTSVNQRRIYMFAHTQIIIINTITLTNLIGLQEHTRVIKMSLQTH
mgnify:CR=1 FL=1